MIITLSEAEFAEVDKALRVAEARIVLNRLRKAGTGAGPNPRKPPPPTRPKELPRRVPKAPKPDPYHMEPDPGADPPPESATVARPAGRARASGQRRFTTKLQGMMGTRPANKAAAEAVRARIAKEYGEEAAQVYRSAHATFF